MTDVDWQALATHAQTLLEETQFDLMIAKAKIRRLEMENETLNYQVMDHQCTPDYEMGQINGQDVAIMVCKQRYGSCKHESKTADED